MLFRGRDEFEKDNREEKREDEEENYRRYMSKVIRRIKKEVDEER